MQSSSLPHLNTTELFSSTPQHHRALLFYTSTSQSSSLRDAHKRYILPLYVHIITMLIMHAHKRYILPLYVHIITMLIMYYMHIIPLTPENESRYHANQGRDLKEP